MRVRRDRLQAGDWLHVRSYGWLGVNIRKAQDHMLRRRYGKDCPRVWGNHDGILLPPDFVGADWGVGEALERGCQTPTLLSEYEKEMAEKGTEIRVFRPLEAVGKPERGLAAVRGWLAGPYKEGYDYVGILLWAWASYGPLGLGNVGLWLWNHTCGRKVQWCTEAVNNAWLYAGQDVCQSSCAAPFHVEQAAGLLPRPAEVMTTLTEITSEVVS